MGCAQSGKKGAAAPSGKAGAEETVSTKLEIYGTGISMNCVCAMLFVQEHKLGKHVECMPHQDTAKPEFVKLNPYHQVPLLKDDGYCLGEGTAILRYLAEKVPNANAYPAKNPQRAAFIDWALDRLGGPLYKKLGPGVVYPLLGFATPPENREEMGKEVTAILQEFADWFLKEKFIGGATVSIADYKAAPYFFAVAHPRAKEEGFVEVPERILQFNKDFREAVVAAASMDGPLKTTLDKDKPVAMLQVSSPVTVETADLIAAKKPAGKGSLEIHGVPVSGNTVSILMLSAREKIGEMKHAMPGTETTQPYFLEMNPWHAIPTVKDGAYTVADSVAILRYCSQAYAPKYYSEFDAKKRGVIDWAMARFSNAIYPEFFKSGYVALGFQPALPTEEAKQEAARNTKDILEGFCKHFLKEKFVAGNSLSIADFKIAPFFFAWAHPKLKEEHYIEVPERLVKFNKDFADAVPEAAILSSAGGFSLKEFLDPKPEAETPAEEEKVDAIQEAMAESLSPVRDVATEVEQDTKGSNGLWCACA